MSVLPLFYSLKTNIFVRLKCGNELISNNVEFTFAEKILQKNILHFSKMYTELLNDPRRNRSPNTTKQRTKPHDN